MCLHHCKPEEGIRFPGIGNADDCELYGCKDQNSGPWQEQLALIYWCITAFHISCLGKLWARSVLIPAEGLQKPSDIFVFIGPEQKNTAQNTGMSEGGVLSKEEGWWVSTGATHLGELWLLSPWPVHCSSRERHAGSHFPLGGLDLGLFSSTLLAPV